MFKKKFGVKLSTYVILAVALHASHVAKAGVTQLSTNGCVSHVAAEKKKGESVEFKDTSTKKKLYYFRLDSGTATLKIKNIKGEQIFFTTLGPGSVVHNSKNNVVEFILVASTDMTYRAAICVTDIS